MACVVYRLAGVRTALVYHAGALGDLIVAVPAIEHWVRDRDAGRPVLLGRGRPGELLQAAGIVGDRWDAGAAWFASAYRGAPPALPAPIDAALAFTAPGGPIEQALASAVSGPVSVVPPLPARREPVVGHHLRAVGAAPADDRAPALQLPAERRRRRIGIAPGSGSARKNWPLERFAAVADALRPHAEVMWLLGPAEEELRPPAADVDLVVRGRPITGTAQAIASCAVVLGNDSGLSHMVAALSVPVVALFAVSDAAVWAPAPSGSPVLVVTPSKITPGDRCAAVPAPPAGASMDDIGVDPVLSACRRLLR